MKNHKEMWTQEKLQDRINYIKSSSIGGRIISIRGLSLGLQILNGLQL